MRNQPDDQINAEHAADVHALARKMRTRLVRESTRDTWYVVNDSADSVAGIPLTPSQDRSIRRVQINGETTDFAMVDELAIVEALRPLRAGEGTIVVLHYR